MVSLAAAAIGTVLHVMGPGRIGAIVDEIQKGLFGAVDLDLVARMAAVLLAMRR
jgi:hypothetical protein